MTLRGSTTVLQAYRKIDGILSVKVVGHEIRFANRFNAYREGGVFLLGGRERDKD